MKAAVRKAAYAQAMATQPKRADRPARWMKHEWNEEKETIVSRWIPGMMPRPSKKWFREGTIEEIEQKENAGQRDLF
jgi:hypothetical protein